MVWMRFTTRVISCTHMIFSSCICNCPHGLHGILLMLEIISPYTILHMVCVAFSSCYPSFLHMLFSTWFSGHSPHAWHHFSICCSPYGLRCILLMLSIMSLYAVLHMVFRSFSSCLTSFLHMLFSIWFALHPPHALHHVSICCSPHGFQVILLMLDIISPYAVLHMVRVAFSSCFPSCVHMLFSTWFSGHSPHAWHHFSICCSPYGLHCILLMLYIMSPYAVLHMVRTHASLCLKPYITNNNKPWGHIL